MTKHIENESFSIVFIAAPSAVFPLVLSLPLLGAVSDCVLLSMRLRRICHEGCHVGDAQRIEQLAWLLFLKIMDDKDQEPELLSDDYVPPTLAVCQTAEAKKPAIENPNFSYLCKKYTA